MEGERLRDQVDRQDRPVAPKAVERLSHEWDRLVTFSQFPRDPWGHLRTTQVVASPVAAVRLRTTAGKRYTRVESATVLIWTLRQVAESHFRCLNAPALLPAVYGGRPYVDGIIKNRLTQQEVAA